ncbi:uncharacterized protein Pyn_35294 [Prunus yedoensis var. nudiflora]|uniref:Uncharacterized protein n=1 Tax=Prunus yedoensis var. nudiflora TaxID=2094558 RepID=A0A314Y6M6_PRUYE|nr:uncharacterized protein Pyn_35294 [Prunus yedoensis var. nudiflora]
MLSAKEQIACEDHLLDPFVENFVLEIKVSFEMQDIELMHIELAVGVMERTMIGESKSFHQVAFDHMRDLKNHLEAVNDIPRKIMMANVINSLLHMDDLSLNLAHCASPWSYSKSHYTCASEKTDLSHHALSDGVRKGGRQALEWRASIAKHLKSGNGICQFCSVFFRYLNASSGNGKRH